MYDPVYKNLSVIHYDMNLFSSLTNSKTMNQKYLFYVVLSGALMMASSVLAETNCDSQAKPAFGCPTGYSMMCNPTGGWHWGCGKESNGAIIEVDGLASSSAETSGVKSTLQTQVKVSGDSSSERLLPTVNKVTDDTGSSEKVLPTVNKKTIAISVDGKGWDAQTKKDIQGKVEKQVENDDAIKSVDITEDNVNLNYSTKAKLFAFIPITMNVDVSSDNEGRVKVKFPWYRFLVKTDFANSAELLNGIFQHNQTDFEFLKTKGSAGAQIEIFITISNALHEISKL